jgi:hypothetical protein
MEPSIDVGPTSAELSTERQGRLLATGLIGLATLAFALDVLLAFGRGGIDPVALGLLLLTLGLFVERLTTRPR